MTGGHGQNWYPSQKPPKKVWEVAQYFFGSIVVIINKIRLTKIMFFAFSIKKNKMSPRHTWYQSCRNDPAGAELPKMPGHGEY